MSPAFLAGHSLGLQTVISGCILALELEQPQLCWSLLAAFPAEVTLRSEEPASRRLTR